MYNYTNQDAPYNAFADLESTFNNLQQQRGSALQDAATQISDYDHKQNKLPEELAKSQLARLTAEKDIQLLPQQQMVAQQNLDAENQFNRLRQMRALLDDTDVPIEQKKNLLRNGLLRNAGIEGQPSLAQAQTAAKTSFLLQEFEKNPGAFAKRLDDQMMVLSRNSKNFHAENLANIKGTSATEVALLKAEAMKKEAADAKAKIPNNAVGFYTMRAEEAYKAGKSDEAVEWLQKAERLQALAAQNAALGQGSTIVVDTNGNLVSKPNAVLPQTSFPGQPQASKLPPGFKEIK